MPSTKRYPEQIARAVAPAPALAYASLSGVGELFLFVVIFCCILFLAYAATKLVAKRSAARGRSKHIEVIDSMFVGTDAQLLIVKAAGEYFLISRSAKKLDMLAKLEVGEEGLRQAADASAAGGAAAGFTASFKSLLEQSLSRGQRGGQGGGQGGGSGVFRGNIDRIRDITKKAGDGKDSDKAGDGKESDKAGDGKDCDKAGDGKDSDDEKKNGK
jgi:flagellar biogenesis protein FliO